MKAQNKLNKSLGDLNSFEITPSGFKGKTTFGHFAVNVFAANTIQVHIGKEETLDDFSYAVVASAINSGFKLEDKADMVVLTTDKVTLEMSKKPVRFRMLDQSGKVLNEDDAAFGTSWIGDQVTTYKKLQKDERFIGLGEKVGNLDRRGEGYTNYNTDYFAYPTNGDPLYTTFPFYIGIHSNVSYGIFMDNSYKSHFNFGASTNRFSSFTAEEGDMNYYFFAGSVAEIIDAYTNLTGKMPLPPKWSMGYQQSRYSYYPDKEVLSVAKNFRDRKIPADVIVLDIHYMDQYKIFTWNNERFPDPKGMIKELKDMGFHVKIIVDPGIKVEKGYKAFEEGMKNNYFIKYPDGELYQGQVWPGWCHFPDFTQAAAREWWGKSFKGLVDDGVDGFWNDMNEIATWGQKLPELIEFDFEGNKATTRRARNVYGLKMTEATYVGTKELLGGKRPFNLTRAAYAGAQRYTAKWTGDNVPSDDHMLLGVRLVNSLGLVGMSFSGYDVGGFAGDPSVDLYARWMSIGAFSPFFRGHTQVNTRAAEPWTMGEEVEEISRNYIQFRYNLMPYIYSGFYESTQSGMPLTRTLAIDYTHDANIYDGRFQNQYLFGPSVLIAPTVSTDAITKVYFPAGSIWYDLYNSKVYQGGQEAYVDAPIKRLPVFVKGSAIIPMQSPVQSMMEKPEKTLMVHVYKGSATNSYVYYEDDGDTYEHEKGAFHKRTISYDPVKKEISFEKAEGSFSSHFTEIKLVLHGFEDVEKTIKVDNKKINITKEFNSFMKPLSHFDPIGSAGAPEGDQVQTLKFANSNGKVTVKW